MLKLTEGRQSWTDRQSPDLNISEAVLEQLDGEDKKDGRNPKVLNEAW